MLAVRNDAATFADDVDPGDEGAGRPLELEAHRLKSLRRMVHVGHGHSPKRLEAHTA